MSGRGRPRGGSAGSSGRKRKTSVWANGRNNNPTDDGKKKAKKNYVKPRNTRKTRNELLDILTDFVPRDILDGWSTSSLSRFFRAKQNHSAACVEAKQVWTDIQEVIGEGYKYPYRIQMYFWGDAFYGERLIFMAFLYINGCNPELMYDFLEARGIKNATKRIKHYRSIEASFNRQPERFKDLYGYHVLNNRYEKFSGEAIHYVKRKERLKGESAGEYQSGEAEALESELDDAAVVQAMLDFESEQQASDKLDCDSKSADQQISMTEIMEEINSEPNSDEEDCDITEDDERALQIQKCGFEMCPEKDIPPSDIRSEIVPNRKPLFKNNKSEDSSSNTTENISVRVGARVGSTVTVCKKGEDSVGIDPNLVDEQCHPQRKHDKDCKLITDLNMSNDSFIKNLIVQDLDAGSEKIYSNIKSILLVTSKSKAKTVIVQCESEGGNDIPDIINETSDCNEQSPTKEEIQPEERQAEVSASNQEAQSENHTNNNAESNVCVNDELVGRSVVGTSVQPDVVGTSVEQHVVGTSVQQETGQLLSACPSENNEKPKTEGKIDSQITQPYHSTPVDDEPEVERKNQLDMSDDMFPEMEKMCDSVEIINSNESINSCEELSELPNGQIIRVTKNTSSQNELLNMTHIEESLADYTLNNCDKAKVLCPEGRLEREYEEPYKFGLFHTCDVAHVVKQSASASTQNQATSILNSTFPQIKKQELLVGCQEHALYMKTVNDEWLEEYRKDHRAQTPATCPPRSQPQSTLESTQVSFNNAQVLTQHWPPAAASQNHEVLKKSVRFDNFVYFIDTYEYKGISEEPSEIANRRRRLLLRARLSTKKQEIAVSQSKNEDDIHDQKKGCDYKDEGPPIVFKV